MKFLRLIITLMLLVSAPSLTKAADEIADANPDVDFSDLIVGISYAISAPEATDSCLCDWSLSNEFIAALNPADECDTLLIVFIRGGGQLTVELDCEGEEITEFTQVFMAHTPDPALTIFKGSGCSLRP